MSVSSIGIQTIMPTTGTSPKQSPDAQQSNARTAEEVQQPVQAPPPPGLGMSVHMRVFFTPPLVGWVGATRRAG